MHYTAVLRKIAVNRIKAEIDDAKKTYGTATICSCFAMSLLVFIGLHLHLSYMDCIKAESKLVAFLLFFGWLLKLYFNRQIERLGIKIHLRDKHTIAEMWNAFKIQHICCPNINKILMRLKKLQQSKAKKWFKLKYQRRLKKLMKLIKSQKRHTVPQIFVCIWMPTSDDITGHASMVLSNGYIHYISHYPEKQGTIGDSRKKLPVFAYNKSILRESRPPDAIIAVPMKLLSAGGFKKIEDWAVNRQHAIDNKKEKFAFKLDNCADTVKKALAEGGFQLANPVFRIITLGMSLPKWIELNVVSTIALKYSPFPIRCIHSGYTLIAFVLSVRR